MDNGRKDGSIALRDEEMIASTRLGTIAILKAVEKK
jgi:hypothetical protein